MLVGMALLATEAFTLNLIVLFTGVILKTGTPDEFCARPHGIRAKQTSIRVDPRISFEVFMFPLPLRNVLCQILLACVR